LTMVGIVLGLLGAVALTRLMVSLLFEVTPTDPATLIAVALLLLLAATALGVLHSGTPSIEHSTRNRPAVRITTFARFVSSRLNRPISAGSQGLGSLRASLRIFVSRLERRSRQSREDPFGRARRNISRTC